MEIDSVVGESSSTTLTGSTSLDKGKGPDKPVVAVYELPWSVPRLSLRPPLVTHIIMIIPSTGWKR
jgi:hypothetical protein